jgi:hypothetical protein
MKLGTKNLVLVLGLFISQISFGFGLGLQFGSTGLIVGKEQMAADRTFKGSMGWNTRKGEKKIIFTGDYVIQNLNLSRIDNERIVGYAGVGGKIETSADFGIRFPLGVAWHAKLDPLEVFLELTPTLYIYPATELGLDGAFGVLWYFKT